jgi:nicotinamidase-related amidase
MRRNNMADALALNPASTAVLVMDFQVRTVDSYAHDGGALLGRTKRLLAAARAVGARVIYVVVGFRPGFPEVSPHNKAFSNIKGSGRFAPGDAVEIHPELAPAGGEVVVTKHRVGAFLGTDLDMILRANGITTLVLSGIATSGVVLSTLRYAADADYRLVVAADCCADGDPEVHRVLTEKVFPRQADVVTADEVIAALR